MRRFVTLGSGRRVTLGAYVRGWRAVKAASPETLYTDSLTGWRDDPTPAGRILAQFRYGMHDRINRHIPGYGVGRKWSPSWYWETWRFARDVNTPRLIVRWAPVEFRQRLAHRLTTD